MSCDIPGYHANYHDANEVKQEFLKAWLTISWCFPRNCLSLKGLKLNGILCLVNFTGFEPVTVFIQLSVCPFMQAQNSQEWFRLKAGIVQGEQQKIILLGWTGQQIWSILSQASFYITLIQVSKCWNTNKSNWSH